MCCGMPTVLLKVFIPLGSKLGNSLEKHYLERSVKTFDDAITLGMSVKLGDAKQSTYIQHEMRQEINPPIRQERFRAPNSGMISSQSNLHGLLVWYREDYIGHLVNVS